MASRVRSFLADGDEASNIHCGLPREVPPSDAFFFIHVIKQSWQITLCYLLVAKGS